MLFFFACCLFRWHNLPFQLLVCFRIVKTCNIIPIVKMVGFQPPWFHPSNVNANTSAAHFTNGSFNIEKRRASTSNIIASTLAEYEMCVKKVPILKKPLFLFRIWFMEKCGPLTTFTSSSLTSSKSVFMFYCRIHLFRNRNIHQLIQFL